MQNARTMYAHLTSKIWYTRFMEHLLPTRIKQHGHRSKLSTFVVEGCLERNFTLNNFKLLENLEKNGIWDDLWTDSKRKTHWILCCYEERGVPLIGDGRSAWLCTYAFHILQWTFCLISTDANYTIELSTQGF